MRGLPGRLCASCLRTPRELLRCAGMTVRGRSSSVEGMGNASRRAPPLVLEVVEVAVMSTRGVAVQKRRM
jgi:hypothetical protein